MLLFTLWIDINEKRIMKIISAKLLALVVLGCIATAQGGYICVINTPSGLYGLICDFTTVL